MPTSVEVADITIIAEQEFSPNIVYSLFGIYDDFLYILF